MRRLPRPSKPSTIYARHTLPPRGRRGAWAAANAAGRERRFTRGERECRRPCKIKIEYHTSFFDAARLKTTGSPHFFVYAAAGREKAKDVPARMM